MEGFGFLHDVKQSRLEQILPLSTENLQCCDISVWWGKQGGTKHKEKTGGEEQKGTRKPAEKALPQARQGENY